MRRGGVGVSNSIEIMPPENNLGRFLGGENTRLVWWRGRILSLIRFYIF